jgi:hypothetical protein
MLVEAHNSISLVERYHAPLRRAYNILLKELPNLLREERLQIAIKAVNNTASPDSIVPTLLVFRAFPRMSQWDAPAASIAARAEAVRNAMAAVRECHAARQITDALRMRNGPQTSYLAGLPINSDVLV